MIGFTRLTKTLSAATPGICLLFLLLTGCSESTPGLQKLGSDAVILAFGDSLTHGTGTEEQYSYPARLAEQTGLTVINAGVPGELSAAGRDRLPGLLERHRPDLLILCHGGNDILRQRDPEAAADNLRAMIAMAHERGIEVLLIAVPKPALLPRTAAFYADVASSTGVPLVRDALADILSRSSLKADAVHPNRDGYARLSDAITDKLQQAGAL
ncbi:lysophospholipase L1-like esterase [Methylohalomonas lacus]|uniref:Lysophospholipase L1-like esterase n=1 Tax=Methylohalomonas lacus TaxID=398773 RepID=A0AAE3HJY3_9GAMM|nr:arylesterase [Methylohalomonas lacus]MCS3902506.1 lysophospholipase L1-like esterase [Methylohalomonas lacus]